MKPTCSPCTETIARVFHEREGMTPCMLAFEQWWSAEKDTLSPVGVMTAWRIFRTGWWKAEDSVNANSHTNDNDNRRGK